jgi:transcriptional regulator with XRE-family HTH domain
MAKQIPIDLKRVEQLAGLGLTQAEIATSLGISERTLRTRKQDSADFAAAIERGRTSAAEAVANVLFELATKKKNLNAIIWYEKTRRGISETTRSEITGKNGTPLIPESTPETRAQAALELIEWRKHMSEQLSGISAAPTPPTSSTPTAG